MAEGRAQETSHDPQDASYSYCFADRSDLWGPYCCGCMNDWYGGDHFRDMNTHFYLHFTRKSPHYYLPELIAVNGSLYPFIFRTSPGELKVFTCSNSNCKHKKNDSAVVEKISTGVQTHPLQDVVVKPSTSGSVPLQNVVKQASTSVPLPTATVQPIPSKEPVPTVTQVVQPMPAKEKAQPSEVKESVPALAVEEKVKPPKVTEQKVVKAAQSTVSHLPKKGEILRILSKTNPPHVMERRPVEFPLLFGTCYKGSSQVPENMWISRAEVTQSIYDGMKDLAVELKDSFDKMGWKTVDCDVCPLIRPGQPYVEHVLSEYHRRNLYGRGRWVTNGHFDLLDGFLRKTERLLRTSQKQGKEKEPSPKPPASTEERPITPPPPTPRSLLHFPLMPMWTSKHTNVLKVSKEEFDEKIESIRGLLKSTNLQKLNEKFGTGMDPAQIMCYWCTVKVLTLAEVVNHICTWQHREKAFSRHHVTVKDLNEYLNMLRASATTKLPEKLKSTSPSLSRTTSTSSIVSAASSVDPNAIKLPFLEGHMNPNETMTKDEVVNFGILVRGMLSDNVTMKKKLNELVQNKGIYVQHCVACSKKMPSPVGVVEHSLSAAHITQIFSLTRQFCRVYDFVPMVSLLLDSYGINHPHITLKNSNIYFDMLKYSLSSQSSAQQEPRISRKEKETVAPFKVSPVPFFSGRTQTHAAMTEATSTELTMKMQKHLTNGRDMKKSLAAVMKSMNVLLESCNLCEKKFPSPISMLEHAFTYSHINKVYSMGRTFCRQEDYVTAVQMIGKAVGISETITLSNVDKKCSVYLNMPGRLLTLPTEFSPSSSAIQLSTTNVKILKATPAPLSSGPSKIAGGMSSSSSSSGKLAQRSEDENITPDDTVSEAGSVKDTYEIMQEKRAENGHERQEDTETAEAPSIPEKHVEKVVATSEIHKKDQGDDSKDEVVSTSAIVKQITLTPACSTSVPNTREEVEEAKEATEKSNFSSDSSGSEGRARSPIEEERKDCLLSPTARVCRYMNERPDSSLISSTYLTEDDLAVVSTKVFSAYGHLRHLSSARCETEDCSFIRPLCPTVCHLCKHTSSCICDYILHLFGSFHRKFIIGPMRTIHVVHVTFWLNALRKLHPEVPFQSNFITSDATIDWTAFAHLLPNPACTISPAATAKFMSVNSLHTHNILTAEQLRKVSTVVSNSLEGGESCWFLPVSQITNIMRAHATKICIVCNYKSKCVCDFVKHLFRPGHCEMLIQKCIVVSVPDVQWWVDKVKILIPVTATALNDKSLWEGTGHVALRYDHSLTSAEKPKECVIS